MESKRILNEAHVYSYSGKFIDETHFQAPDGTLYDLKTSQLDQGTGGNFGGGGGGGNFDGGGGGTSKDNRDGGDDQNDKSPDSKITPSRFAQFYDIKTGKKYKWENKHFVEVE